MTVTSVNVLAVLVGILFIVMGIFEVIGGFRLRHAVHTWSQPTHDGTATGPFTPSSA